MVPRQVVAVVLAALLLAGCGGGGGDAGGGEGGGGGELLVFGAASLDTAVSQYAEAFAARTGAKVRTSFAGSDQLATQIRQGAPADVFASADTEFPARLHGEGLVEEPRIFASNRLVIAVRSDSPIESLADLAEPGVKLVVGDPGVPVGAYTGAALDQLPAAERQAILANVRSEEPDVGSVLAKLIQQAADAVIVYSTDATAAGGGLRAIPLPDELQPEIAYAIAAVNDGPGPKQLAQEFIEGLIEGDGADSLRRAGFLPPP